MSKVIQKKLSKSYKGNFQLDEFEEELQDSIKKGWTPIGGHTITPPEKDSLDDHYIIIQILYK
jgi:hypothetical protein